MPLYSEAIDALGTNDSVLRARLLARLAQNLVVTERDRRHALSAEAVDIARRVGDRFGLADVLHARVNAINDPTTLAERLALNAELETLADDLGSLELRSRATLQRADTLLESGDPIGAARALTRSEELRSQSRIPSMIHWVRVARAGWSLMCGSSDAEQQALAAF